jgi:Smg protein
MGGLLPCPAGVTKNYTEIMLDILVYLYESFRMVALTPDRDALEKRLFAAGFEEADINAALDWYANLAGSATHERLALAYDRHYAPEEIERLNDACRAELAYLVSAEILDPESREWVISGLMGLGGEDIEPDHVRWMTLIVLWSRGLIEHFTHLEDMLLNHEPERLH